MGIAIDSEAVPLAADDDGTMRIGHSGVTLDAVLAALRAGTSPDEILQRYPSLDPADAYTVIGYCFRHRAHIDRYLRTRSSARHESELPRRTQGASSLPDVQHALPVNENPQESGVAEFDAFVPMPPVKQRTVRLRIESCRKAVPRVVEPEDADGKEAGSCFSAVASH